ncbi:MAG TPA: hypothetical protein VFX67_03625 [Burkholderiales bacterium]|nr:hypothetical protein [Burkholderiales bacterium]
MSSPRYLAAHLLMPRLLREKGAAALEAIERNDADFFVPVWAEAGFRFTPRLMYLPRDDLRIGVLTLPMPRESTEAYLAAIVGTASDASLPRYFLWEKGEDAGTVIGEWAGSAHRNYGAGPPFTGNLAGDCAKFIDRVAELCSN